MKFLFKFKLKEILTILTAIVLAAGIYRIYDNFVYNKIISYNNQEITFEGSITDIAEHSGDKCTYYLNGKINNNTKADITLYNDLYDCSINDCVKFTGIAELPENDYLFNSLDYNKSKGIFLSCYEVSSFEVIPDNSFSVRKILYNYKQRISAFINRNLPKEQSAMLCGMMFGDKNEMDADDKTLFYRTGIGHVMAVSGLHLVLFCGIFSFLFDKLRFGRIKRFVLLELLMIAFAVISGLSDSIIRASLMMTILNIAPLFFRKADTLNSIAIAFIILTTMNPFSISNPSLVLSITGTFSAGVFAPFITNRMKNTTFIQKQIKNAVYMFLVSLGVMPFSIIFFGEGSLLSPIANIILTPLCMIALFLALIASLLVFLNPVFIIKPAGIICEAVMLSVRYTGKLSFASLNFSEIMTFVSAAAVLLCIVVFLIFRTRKALVISTAVSVAVSIVVFSSVRLMTLNNLNIALLGDKGVDVIVISQNGKAEIIDISGRKKNSQYALKFLHQNNINKLEGIIIKSNALQAISAYNNSFSLIDAGRITIPDDTFIRNDMKICGYTPVFSDYSNTEFDFSDVDISIDNTRISVEYESFRFICDSKCHDEKATVYAEYENVFNPPVANAVIVPEYENIYGFKNLITERNTHIIVRQDGSFQIGGL